mmetsp:Transcript_42111/g.84550  ORF Transcript_42111/g.84550 Transcript_42111/m.84550 type:complete len:203 (+) Transcript_42111:1300-1908(+)
MDGLIAVPTESLVSCVCGIGGDLRLSQCADRTATVEPPGRTSSRNVPRRATFSHYGAVGGEKPDGTLRRWNWLSTHDYCNRGRLVPYFAQNAEVLLRSLSWARRTMREVVALQAALDGQKGSAALRTRAQLDTCAAVINAGLGCLAAYAEAHANDTVGPTLRASDLLALQPDRATLPRPTSLLAPASAIQGSYASTSRYRTP